MSFQCTPKYVKTCFITFYWCALILTDKNNVHQLYKTLTQNFFRIPMKHIISFANDPHLSVLKEE